MIAEEMMKERPILFNGAMVRAILEGRKTQTRRVIKPTMTKPRIAPLTMEPWLIDGEQEVDDQDKPCWVGSHPDYPTDGKWFSCDYGVPGDRLWVRETHTVNAFSETLYKADWDAQGYESKGMGWKSSRYMPRIHSRITLEVVEVRVERVQDISGKDALAEGVAVSHGQTPQSMFWALWDSINAKRGYGWNSNPWVWVVEFKQIED